MSSLYDLRAEYKQLYDIMSDGDVDEQTISDTLESLSFEIEAKAAGYMQVINQLEMEAEACKKQADFFANKQKTRESNIKRMKQALCTAMVDMDLKELQAGDYMLKVQNNGGQQPLVIDGEVPESMTKITIEPDNKKIREFLINNSCDWAHLEPRGKHLAIK